jgi:hypothetical protein
MAAPAPRRGGLGWAILAAALAVPGFLFYNWWSHLKAEHDRGVSAKARTRAEGSMFQTPPASGRLVNPMASSTIAPAGYPPAGLAGKAPQAGVMPPAAAAPAGSPAPVPAPAAAPPQVAAAAPVPRASSISAAPGSVAMSSAAAVVLPRDPMMSPLDLVRIQEEAAEAAARAQALLDAEARSRAPKRTAKPPKRRPIETRIQLVGIVNNTAMINDLELNAGDQFTVEGYAGKVTVRKISSTDAVVTLEYEGRKFKLSMNAE